MTTSALATLRAAVLTAPSASARAEALLKVGACLAQLGRIEEARNILLDIRQEFSEGKFPRVSIRLMMLEGIVSYYDNLTNSSDRVRRAYALAKAGGVSDLRAEASVWMAHLAFNFDDYSSLKLALADALNGFEYLDDSHRSRACLIVADALQYLADRSMASNWYTLSRIFCRRAHDRGVMAAIEYNRLSIGLSRIRVDRALGCSTDNADYRDWLGELGSVERLHLGFDARALSGLLKLCSVYTHEMRGDFCKAYDELLRIRNSDIAARCGVSDRLLTIEMKWCQSKIEAFSNEIDSLNSDDFNIELLTDNDRLIGIFLIKELYSRKQITFNNDRYAELMADAVSSFEQSVTYMSRAIEVSSNYYQKIRSVALLRDDAPSI